MTRPEEEIRWISDAIRGDRQAFAELCRAYYEPLRQYAAARLVRADLVDDVVQEALLRVHESLPTWDVETPFWPFLQGCARNVIFEHLRSLQKSARHLTDPVVARLAERRLDAMTAGEDDSLDQRLSALKQCLQSVPRTAQQLLRAVYEEQKAIPELADGMRMRPNALAARLYRLRCQLRDCIQRRLAAQGA